MVAISWASSGCPFSSISGMRGKMPPAVASNELPALERQLGVGLRSEQHAPEPRLDARQPGLAVGLEAQNHDRRGVRRARETESVRIFDAQTIQPDHLGRTRKCRLFLQHADEAARLAPAQRPAKTALPRATEEIPLDCLPV